MATGVPRTQQVFGYIRSEATKQAATLEKELYALRDAMQKECLLSRGRFDTRSFDCVYTVEFWTNQNEELPMASRIIPANSEFMCTPDWFGVNVTNYQENATRFNTASVGASNAAMGSALGTAIGAVTSGGVSRAIETHKAKKDLQKECNRPGAETIKDCEDYLKQTKEEKVKKEKGSGENNNKKNNKNNQNNNLSFDRDCSTLGAEMVKDGFQADDFPGKSPNEVVANMDTITDPKYLKWKDECKGKPFSMINGEWVGDDDKIKKAKECQELEKAWTPIQEERTRICKELAKKQ